LPAADRDPFWAELLGAKDRVAEKLSQGASAGISYHLIVDATVQASPYHDLPLSMPIEVHQLVMAANATAEAIDVGAKHATSGEKVVGGVKAAASYAEKTMRTGAAAASGFFQGFFAPEIKKLRKRKKPRRG
jgi:hypothetical protein